MLFLPPHPPQPPRRHLLLHAILLQAFVEIPKVHLIQRLILIKAAKHHGFLARGGIDVALQALGADFLHHALHGGVDATHGLVIVGETAFEHGVAGLGDGAHHPVAAVGDEVIDGI